MGEAKREESCIKNACHGDHRANSEQCPVIEKQREINQISTHRNAGILEARKIVEKWLETWRPKPTFSSGDESLRRYVEYKMSNFPIRETPRRRMEWDYLETTESRKS
jgi:hypothetical protein